MKGAVVGFGLSEPSTSGIFWGQMHELAQAMSQKRQAWRRTSLHAHLNLMIAITPEELLRASRGGGGRAMSAPSGYSVRIRIQMEAACAFTRDATAAVPGSIQTPMASKKSRASKKKRLCDNLSLSALRTPKSTAT